MKHRKICAVLLCLCLALLCVPIRANAAEIVDSGTCGDDLTWTLYDSGQLKISGTGAMTSWGNVSIVPWHASRASITSVSLPSGLTSISAWAFYGTSITEVRIPDKTTGIGTGAFAACASLKKIEYSIYGDAFKSVSGVLLNKDGTELLIYPAGKTETYYNVPKGVTSIGARAFQGAANLASVFIPASVTSIGYYAFYGTNLTDVYYGGTAADWQSVSVAASGNNPLTNAARHYGVSGLIGKNVAWTLTDDGTLTISGTGEMKDFSTGNLSLENRPWYSSLDSITSVVIEGGVTSIGNSAFVNCSRLTSVTIPEGVTRIGSCAFEHCYSLTSITIPDSVTSIGAAAFESSGLTSITIPEGVTSIYFETFYYCHALTSIQLPSTLTSIGDNAFVGCSFTSITIPEGVTFIDYNAFYHCDALTSIQLPTTLTSIGGGAFDECDDLKDVYYTGSASQWNAIANECDMSGMTIHYTSIGDAQSTAEGSGTKTWSIPIQYAAGAAAFACGAEYGSDGQCLGVTVLELLQGEEKTLTVDIKAGSVLKVFLIDKAGFRPVCENREFKS